MQCAASWSARYWVGEKSYLCVSSVKLVFGCADGTTASGLREARRLVEQDHADVLIGPTTGDEGLELQDYARPTQRRRS